MPTLLIPPVCLFIVNWVFFVVIDSLLPTRSWSTYCTLSIGTAMMAGNMQAANYKSAADLS